MFVLEPAEAVELDWAVEPAEVVDTVALEVAKAAPLVAVVEDIGVAYIADSYHNTIGHIAEYISFDLDILDNYSLFHL